MPCGVRMHSEVKEYDKKKITPLYFDNKYVGSSSGMHTLYNLLLRLFHETIAPRAGNIDEIRPDTVNLLLRSHLIYLKGPNYLCEGIDVMDFIFQEMWTCLISKKTPMYAPYVMALIIAKNTGVPLVTTNLVTHLPVRPQKKFSEKEKERVAYSELEGEFDEGGEDSEEADDDDDPETMDISPPRRPRMKNVGNTFVRRCHLHAIFLHCCGKGSC